MNHLIASAARPAARLIALLALLGMTACGSAPAQVPAAAPALAPVPAAAVVPGAGRHIKPLGISISPASASVAPGASAVFAARPDGGEVIRLMIDWKIREGAAGGKVELLGEEMNGAATVKYTAPATGGGPYHLVASLRLNPAVQAVATIN